MWGRPAAAAIAGTLVIASTGPGWNGNVHTIYRVAFNWSAGQFNMIQPGWSTDAQARQTESPVTLYAFIASNSTGPQNSVGMLRRDMGSDVAYFRYVISRKQ